MELDGSRSGACSQPGAPRPESQCRRADRSPEPSDRCFAKTPTLSSLVSCEFLNDPAADQTGSRHRLLCPLGLKVLADLILRPARSRRYFTNSTGSGTFRRIAIGHWSAEPASFGCASCVTHAHEPETTQSTAPPSAVNCGQLPPAPPV
jgi:hypothetical protein